MDRNILAEKVRAVLPRNTIGRYDLLPIFGIPDLFDEIVKFLSGPYHSKIEYVAAPEAIGWILGTAIARELKAGFIPVRKGGKLPYAEIDLHSVSFTDYSGQEKVLQIPKVSSNSNGRILIVDEWIETGTQVNSIIKLFENSTVAGIAAIGIDRNVNTAKWIDTAFVTYVGIDI